MYNVEVALFWHSYFSDSFWREPAKKWAGLSWFPARKTKHGSLKYTCGAKLIITNIMGASQALKLPDARGEPRQRKNAKVFARGVVRYSGFNFRSWVGLPCRSLSIYTSLWSPYALNLRPSSPWQGWHNTDNYCKYGDSRPTNVQADASHSEAPAVMMWQWQRSNRNKITMKCFAELQICDNSPEWTDKRCFPSLYFHQ